MFGSHNEQFAVVILFTSEPLRVDNDIIQRSHNYEKFGVCSILGDCSYIKGQLGLIESAKR